MTDFCAVPYFDTVLGGRCHVFAARYPNALLVIVDKLVRRPVWLEARRG
jgi:hypothetical protein